MAELREAYKELVEEEDFGQQNGSTRVVTDSRVTTRRDRIIKHSIRRGLIIILGCLLLYFLGISRLMASTETTFFNTTYFSGSRINSNGTPDGIASHAIKVPLEAHIMSKCPDAKDCLQQLIIPTMERVNDKVDFKLSFIGSVDDKSSEVVCKHGPEECIGNMIMLCAANLPFPSSKNGDNNPLIPTIRSLGFANCMVGSYERIPRRALVESCALEHGISFDALNRCASQQDDSDGDDAPDDPSGISLLRKSVIHSEDLGVKTSCTVRLDEQVWCVRDNGVWKDCAKGGAGSQVEALVEEVSRLYKQRN